MPFEAFSFLTWLKECHTFENMLKWEFKNFSFFVVVVMTQLISQLSVHNEGGQNLSFHQSEPLSDLRDN